MPPNGIEESPINLNTMRMVVQTFGALEEEEFKNIEELKGPLKGIKQNFGKILSNGKMPVRHGYSLSWHGYGSRTSSCLCRKYGDGVQP